MFNWELFKYWTKIYKKINIYKDTILNEKIIKKLISKNDYVFHLAASVGVKFILENPLKSIDTNLNGTKLILKYCDIFKKVLIASSSEVYGLNNKKEFIEKDVHTIGNSSFLDGVMLPQNWLMNFMQMPTRLKEI